MMKLPWIYAIEFKLYGTLKFFNTRSHIADTENLDPINFLSSSPRGSLDKFFPFLIG